MLYETESLTEASSVGQVQIDKKYALEDHIGAQWRGSWAMGGGMLDCSL